MVAGDDFTYFVTLLWFLQAQPALDVLKKVEKKHRGKAVEDENPEDFIDQDTPNGQKKLLAPQMANQYCPSTVEKSYDAKLVV